MFIFKLFNQSVQDSKALEWIIERFCSLYSMIYRLYTQDKLGKIINYRLVVLFFCDLTSQF